MESEEAVYPHIGKHLARAIPEQDQLRVYIAEHDQFKLLIQGQWQMHSGHA